MEQQTFKMVA